MKNKLFRLINQNEQGFSLLIAVFALVLLSVLGLSIFAVSGSTQKTAVHERTDQAVYYLAEAGLVKGKKDLQEKIDPIWNHEKWDEDTSTEDKYIEVAEMIRTNYPSKPNAKTYKSEDGHFEEHFNKKTSAEIEIVGSGKLYMIKSTGKIDGPSQTRAVSQKITIKDDGEIETDGGIKETDPDSPIETPEPGDDTGNEDDEPITGPDPEEEDPITEPDPEEDPTDNPDPEEEETGKNDEDLDNPFQGDVIVYTKDGTLKDDNGKGFKDKHDKYPENLAFPNDDQLNKLFSLPENLNELPIRTTITLDKNFVVNDTTLFNNRSVNFVTESEQTIYINGNTDLSKTTFNVSGNGQINIVVLGNLTINTLTITSTDGTRVNLVVKDKLTLSNDNTINIDANIYAYKSQETLSLNKPSINGTIVTNAEVIKMDGNANSTIKGICAPNADYSSGGKYNVTGKIVVETFSGNGTPSVGKVPDINYNPCETPSILR